MTCSASLCKMLMGWHHIGCAAGKSLITGMPQCPRTLVYILGHDTINGAPMYGTSADLGDRLLLSGEEVEILYSLSFCHHDLDPSPQFTPPQKKLEPLLRSGAQKDAGYLMLGLHIQESTETKPLLLSRSQFKTVGGHNQVHSDRQPTLAHNPVCRLLETNCPPSPTCPGTGL
jgi:hypothetical protein